MSAAAEFPRQFPSATAGPKPELSGQSATSQPSLAVVSELPVQRGPESGSFEMMGRLAGGVAHDFNNLLTGIGLYCDLLSSSLDADHPARRYADEIRNASLQAGGLVRQMLAIVRPGNGNARLLSLHQTIEGMGNMLRRLIGENIELIFRFDANAGLVCMDPAHAQQIVLNLLLNSRDAMPGGGRISVETRQCKVQAIGEADGAPLLLPCLLLTISDDGAGMDEATRARVFEPFFTTKPAGKGSGLGLATVRNLVSTAGGLVHIASRCGHGTRVSVLLPAAPRAFCDPQISERPHDHEGALPAGEKE